uniref:Fork-head domain-containing protein n=1 Tax=Gongylonema pulchrum TaxID=637853 RepID=A0A183CZL0_9BILA
LDWLLKGYAVSSDKWPAAAKTWYFGADDSSIRSSSSTISLDSYDAAASDVCRSYDDDGDKNSDSVEISEDSDSCLHAEQQFLAADSSTTEAQYRNEPNFTQFSLWSCPENDRNQEESQPLSTDILRQRKLSQLCCKNQFTCYDYQYSFLPPGSRFTGNSCSTSTTTTGSYSDLSLVSSNSLSSAYFSDSTSLSPAPTIFQFSNDFLEEAKSDGENLAGNCGQGFPQQIAGSVVPSSSTVKADKTVKKTGVSVENAQATATNPAYFGTSANPGLLGSRNADTSEPKQRFLSTSEIGSSSSSICENWESLLFCSDDENIRRYVKRAFKYSRVFEILSISSNRFHVSPYSYGLGLPLSYLNSWWPQVGFQADVNCPEAYQKPPSRRTTHCFTRKKKKKRNERKGESGYHSENSTPPLPAEAEGARETVLIEGRKTSESLDFPGSSNITEESRKGDPSENARSGEDSSSNGLIFLYFCVL